MTLEPASNFSFFQKPKQDTDTKHQTHINNTYKMPTKPSYKSKIVSVIASLGTRGGSSLAAIKKALNAEPKQYRYIITAIDKGVADGTFTYVMTQNGARYTGGKYKVAKKDTKKVAKKVVKKKVAKVAKKKVVKKKVAKKKVAKKKVAMKKKKTKTAQKMFWVMTVDKQFRGKKRTGYLIRDTSDTYLLDKDGEEIDQVYDGQEVYDEKGKILDLNDWFYSREFDFCQDNGENHFLELSASAGIPEYDDEDNVTLWYDEMTSGDCDMLTEDEVNKIKKQIDSFYI